MPRGALRTVLTLFPRPTLRTKAWARGPPPRYCARRDTTRLGTAHLRGVERTRLAMSSGLWTQRPARVQRLAGTARTSDGRRTPGTSPGMRQLALLWLLGRCAPDGDPPRRRPDFPVEQRQAHPAAGHHRPLSVRLHRRGAGSGPGCSKGSSENWHLLLEVIAAGSRVRHSGLRGGADA